MNEREKSTAVYWLKFIGIHLAIGIFWVAEAIGEFLSLLHHAIDWALPPVILWLDLQASKLRARRRDLLASRGK